MLFAVWGVPAWLRAPKAKRRDPAGGLNWGGTWELEEPLSETMGEDISDVRGLGKNRDSVGFGRPDSRDGVVDVVGGRRLPAPVEVEEKMDSSV